MAMRNHQLLHRCKYSAQELRELYEKTPFAIAFEWKYFADDRSDFSIEIAEVSIDSISDSGIYVCFLHGYKSINELVPFENITALIYSNNTDNTPRISIKGWSCHVLEVLNETTWNQYLV